MLGPLKSIQILVTKLLREARATFSGRDVEVFSSRLLTFMEKLEPFTWSDLPITQGSICGATVVQFVRQIQSGVS